MQDRGRARGQAFREHREQPFLLFEVGAATDVPGDDLLAAHVVHRREVRLASRDLELRDVGAELGERPLGREVALEQVRHPSAGVAPVRAVAPPRVRGADPAPQSYAAHDPEHRLGRHAPAELADQAHADLPVAAPVGRPPPDLADRGFQVGACHMCLSSNKSACRHQLI